MENSNRIIKFRAWDKKRKRMYQVNDIEGLMQNTWICPKGSDDGNWEDEVQLMQYTGLKDKNGKEIYEKDIVKYCPNKKIPKYISWQLPVEWDKNKNGWNFIKSSCDRGFITVSGNIYENPELLK